MPPKSVLIEKNRRKNSMKKHPERWLKRAFTEPGKGWWVAFQCRYDFGLMVFEGGRIHAFLLFPQQKAVSVQGTYYYCIYKERTLTELLKQSFIHVCRLLEIFPGWNWSGRAQTRMLIFNCFVKVAAAAFFSMIQDTVLLAVWDWTWLF